MLSTYEDYKPEPMSLSLEEMAALHQEMAGESRFMARYAWGRIGKSILQEAYW